MNTTLLYVGVTIAAILAVSSVVAYSVYVHHKTYGYWIWELPPQEDVQEATSEEVTPQSAIALYVDSFSDVEMRGMAQAGMTTDLLGSFFARDDYETQEIEDDDIEIVPTRAFPTKVVAVSSEEVVLNGLFMPRQPFSNGTITDTLGEIHVKHPVLDMDILTRKHLIIAGIQGNGKTQTQIRFMVEDIKRGAQVWWLTPHLTLYNEEDQPTDLRPIEKHFRQVFDYTEIGLHLRAFAAESTRRLTHYRNNEPVGETIVVYLDEWPGIVQVLGDEVTESLQIIAREGRKCRVFLVLLSQDVHVKTLGFESGIREQFNTRLVGRVDQASWLALVGKGFPRYKPSKPGEWTYAGGWEDPQVVQIGLTPASLIEEIAKTEPKVFTDIDVSSVPQGTTSVNDQVALVLQVRSFLYENDKISNREIARRLWPDKTTDGGGRYATEAGVLRALAVPLLPVTPPVETAVPALQEASVTP